MHTGNLRMYIGTKEGGDHADDDDDDDEPSLMIF